MNAVTRVVATGGEIAGCATVDALTRAGWPDAPPGGTLACTGAGDAFRHETDDGWAGWPSHRALQGPDPGPTADKPGVTCPPV